MSSTPQPLSPPYNNASPVLASSARQTTSSIQQTTSPTRTTSSANHNQARQRTTRLDGDNGLRRGCYGACHRYLRQDRRIVEVQYSCDCCIETSLTHTLTCFLLQRLPMKHSFGHSCLASLTWSNSCLISSTLPSLVDLLPYPSCPV